MSSIKQNLTNIRQFLTDNNLDFYIIPHDDEYLSEYIPPENERLAWATGFTGSAGMAIISQDSAAIFVDGRYTVQVKEQIDSSLYTILHTYILQIFFTNNFCEYFKCKMYRH